MASVNEGPKREMGVAEVIGADGSMVGMAVLVSPRLAITCAHVVEEVLERDPFYGSSLSNLVLTLRFPLILTATTRPAKVIKYRTMDFAETPIASVSNDPPDLALLELEKPAPEAAGVAVLAELAADQTMDRGVSVFGHLLNPATRHTYPTGVHVEASLSARARDEWRQIDPRERDRFIQRGFSGAGVWSRDHEATIGIVVAKNTGTRAAYMLPVAKVIEFANETVVRIPNERRTLSSAFGAAFTIFSTFSFLLLLTHFIADKIPGWPLSLANGVTILGAFYGLHFSAIFQSLSLTLFFLPFAASFREHPWQRRVPQFGFSRAPASGARSTTSAVTTLVVLVVLPLAANIHFLNRFENEGYVYVNMRPFGFDPEPLLQLDPGACGREDAGRRYCRHPDAGRYFVTTPEDGFSGAYFNNGYQFGDRGQSERGSVTFIPILQPLLLWALTLAHIGLVGVLGSRLMRRPEALRRK